MKKSNITTIKIPSKTIAIVLPAYNEARVIADVLRKLPKIIVIKKQKYSVRVIVVDDGSVDYTAVEVAKVQQAKLISHIINSGAGAATRTGIHYAEQTGSDYVITMDSDGQHSPKDVNALIKEIVKNKHDFIIGSRLKGQGNMPTHKKIGNAGLGIITFLLLGVYASDTQSGLKAMNRKAAQSMNYDSNNYAFCSEMIWRAHKAGLRIGEVPIRAIYTDYSVSRGQRSFSGAVSIIGQLFKRRFMDFMHE